MPRLKPKTAVPAARKYTRRSEDQRIADLEARIQALKERAATKAATKDPAYRYVSKAIKAIDAAMGSTSDQTIRTALHEARAPLSACMQLKGVLMPQGRRSGSAVEPDAVLAYVQKNPGQRGEHIAAGLGTDSKAIRPAMKRLIEAGSVRTKGERRGMQYWGAG
jgi:prophage DNA circulation protein